MLINRYKICSKKRYDKNTHQFRTVKPARRAPRAAYCSLLIVLCSLLIVSCRTAPPQFDALLNEQTHLPLDTGAQIYLLANVKQARPIIEMLPINELHDQQTKQMLDRTNYAAAALFPYESGRQFQLAAYGNYPSGRAGMALNSNKYWSKQTDSSGKTYWYAQISRMSLAIESKQAFAVSFINRDEHAGPRAQEPGVKIPEGFSDFSMGITGNQGAALSLWMNNPGAVISDMMTNMGAPLRFPVEQLFINIYPFGNEYASSGRAGEENYYTGGHSTAIQYEAIIRMIFANATQARGAVTMLNLAQGFAPADLEIASIFLANPPVLNGANVDIKSARLSENDLKVLLGLLF